MTDTAGRNPPVMPPGREPHMTRPVMVWADVDLGVAEMVEYLQTIPGLRTLSSCQGTIGEGGPHPYRAQVMATWPPELRERLATEFDITELGTCWGYLHPRPALAVVKAVEASRE